MISGIILARANGAAKPAGPHPHGGPRRSQALLGRLRLPSRPTGNLVSGRSSTSGRPPAPASRCAWSASSTGRRSSAARSRTPSRGPIRFRSRLDPPKKTLSRQADRSARDPQNSRSAAWSPICQGWVCSLPRRASAMPRREPVRDDGLREHTPDVATRNLGRARPAPEALRGARPSQRVGGRCAGTARAVGIVIERRRHHDPSSELVSRRCRRCCYSTSGAGRLSFASARVGARHGDSSRRRARRAGGDLPDRGGSGPVSVIDLYRAQFDRIIRAFSYQDLLRRMTNRLASL